MAINNDITPFSTSGNNNTACDSPKYTIFALDIVYCVLYRNNFDGIFYFYIMK